MEEKRKLSVQERFGKAAEEAIKAASKMTHEECLHQARINSGWYKTEAEKEAAEEKIKKSKADKSGRPISN